MNLLTDCMFFYLLVCDYQSITVTEIVLFVQLSRYNLRDFFGEPPVGIVIRISWAKISMFSIVLR